MITTRPTVTADGCTWSIDTFIDAYRYTRSGAPSTPPAAANTASPATSNPSPTSEERLHDLGQIRFAL